jgi:hypothetical protein
MINHMPITQWLLLHVSTFPLCLLVIGISISFSLLAVLLTAGAIPESKIGRYKGVSTILFGGITFLYSVLLIVIVTTSWITFNSANLNVQKEASCLVELYRSADAFPKEIGQEIHALLEGYARNVIDFEWRSLQKSELDNRVTIISKKLWAIYTTGFTAKTPTEQLFLQKSIDKITELRECRTKRLNDSQVGVYPILWAMIIAGEMVTVSSISLFSEVLKARILTATFFAILIGLIFFTILLFDFPFTGSANSIIVQPTPIKQAMLNW